MLTLAKLLFELLKCKQIVFLSSVITRSGPGQTPTLTLVSIFASFSSAIMVCMIGWDGGPTRSGDHNKAFPTSAAAWMVFPHSTQ